MLEALKENEVLYSLLSWVLVILLGWGIDRFALPKLKQLAIRWESPTQGVFFESLRGKIVWLFFFIGIRSVFAFLPIPEHWADVCKMWSTALATFVFFVIVTNAMVSTVKKVTHDDNNKKGSTSIIENVIRIIFFCLGSLIILEEFHISITPILTALGVGALAVALALQDTLGNLFSGISFIAGKRIKPGHYIRLNSGEEGFIEDISWRSTVIQETNNNRIIVPNQKIATAIISNFNLSHEELLVRIPIGVAYSSDLEKVDRLCVEEAINVQHQLYGEDFIFQPIVRFRSFGDSSIDFIVIMKSKNYTDQFLIIDQFIRKIHARFHKEGVEIPFPMRTVIHRQE